MTRRLLAALAAVALAGGLAGCGLPGHRTTGDTLAGLPQPELPTSQGPGGALAAAPTSVVAEPLRGRTPGAVLRLNATQVCALDRKAKPVVPAALRTKVFAAYGLRYPNADHDLDALVPLSLGGASTAANLWPLATGTALHEKFQLDQKLRTLVCSDEISLQTAQHEEEDDWYQAWLTNVDPE